LKCEFCNEIATEKHHISYFSEQTVGVCAFHGDDIHIHPELYAKYIKYQKGDSTLFYSQNKRIVRFCQQISLEQHRARRRK